MSEASSWRGRLDLVTDRIVLSGDLPRNEVRAVEALTGWRAAGVTHVLDTRAELDDGDFLRRHAPELAYGRIPTEDDGYARPDWWFDQGVRFAREALAGPRNVLLVHCAMGINRSPSMVFRILLDLGWAPVAALDTIRAARPIADIWYAPDALDHYHRRHGLTSEARAEDAARVEAWLRGY